jgi:hypothetical protein
VVVERKQTWKKGGSGGEGRYGRGRQGKGMVRMGRKTTKERLTMPLQKQ